MSSKPFDNSGAFKDFCELCDEIEKNPSYNTKTELIGEFVKDFELVI